MTEAVIIEPIVILDTPCDRLARVDHIDGAVHILFTQTRPSVDTPAGLENVLASRLVMTAAAYLRFRAALAEEHAGANGAQPAEADASRVPPSCDGAITPSSWIRMRSDYNKALGGRLRAIREALKKTEQEAARAAHVGLQTYLRYEAGQIGRWSSWKVQNYADAWNVRLDFLYEGGDRPMFCEGGPPPPEASNVIDWKTANARKKGQTPLCGRDQ